MKVDAVPDILNAWVRWGVVNHPLITTFIYHHAIIVTMDDIDQSLVYFVCGVCVGSRSKQIRTSFRSPVHSVGARMSRGPEIEL